MIGKWNDIWTRFPVSIRVEKHGPNTPKRKFHDPAWCRPQWDTASVGGKTTRLDLDCWDAIERCLVLYWMCKLASGGSAALVAVSPHTANLHAATNVQEIAKLQVCDRVWAMKAADKLESLAKKDCLRAACMDDTRGSYFSWHDSQVFEQVL